MVCIAAFIILALIGVFVGIISVFKPKIGKAYLKALKKSWSCLWKKVRLQKCELGFKDDVKNTLLSKIIIKHPAWIRPLSAIIEITSVLIVLVAIWALLTALKSLLALWALGSCNVTKPSACSLGAEVCSIDESEPTNIFESTGRWFTEWGEIFEAIPEKFHFYDAADYEFEYIGDNKADKPIAVDIFDPGCSVCLKSYRNQKQAGFFNEYNIRLVPFAIQDTDGTYKFANSEIIVRYMLAVDKVKQGIAMQLIDRIFTETDSDNVSYQNKFNDDYSRDEAAMKIETWLKEFGLTDEEIKQTKNLANSEDTTTRMETNREIIEDELKIKSIPTVIYDGTKHTGLWKDE